MTIAELAALHTGVTVEDIDLDEVRDNLDHVAKRYLDIDGATFLARRAAGEYDGVDTPAVMRVMDVAELLD
jgi:hypothetical protein